MGIERRITFIIGRDGFALWKLYRLKTLASYFRSVVILKNITKDEHVNAEHSLKVISIGSQHNDLCQLWIEGSDAELACMVLTDFIANEFEIVNTSHRKTEVFSYSVIEKHPTFALPFAITYSYKEIESETPCEKYSLLSKLSSMLDARSAQIVFDAILEREAISSTGLAHGVAVPHIMMEEVQQPSLAVMKLSTPTDWYSKLGNVTTIIALLVPKSASKPVLIACTQLTRHLLSADFCELLTSTREPEALKAILFHTMAKQVNRNISL